MQTLMPETGRGGGTEVDVLSRSLFTELLVICSEVTSPDPAPREAALLPPSLCPQVLTLSVSLGLGPRTGFSLGAQVVMVMLGGTPLPLGG